MTVTRWEITKFGADASRSFVALVMALPGSAGAPRAQLLHTCAGVERRDAQTMHGARTSAWLPATSRIGSPYPQFGAAGRMHRAMTMWEENQPVDVIRSALETVPWQCSCKRRGVGQESGLETLHHTLKTDRERHRHTVGHG